MKKITLFFIASLFTGLALADNASSESTSVSASGASVTTGTAQGQGQTIDSHAVTNAVDVSRSVGVAVAPALATTLTETCMGSTSVGAGWSGMGLSFGTTWRDSACVRRLDARQVSAFGNVPVAMEMMCDSELVREAAKRAGRPCVDDGGKPYGITEVAPAPQVQAEPTPEAAAPVVQKIVHE